MATTYRVGPCSILFGAGDTADGSTMINLGDIETVTFDPGIASTGVTTAQTHDAYDASGIYALPPNPTVQAELYDHSIDMLAELVLGGEMTAQTLGLGGPIEKVAVKTLCLVPTFEKDQGAAAPNAIWLPAAMVENLSGIVFNRMQNGGNSGSTYSVSFKGARAKTVNHWNGTASESIAVPEKAQFAFIGDPTAYGITWNIPAL
jgi:hypothetical protein